MIRVLCFTNSGVCGIAAAGVLRDYSTLRNIPQFYCAHRSCGAWCVVCSRLTASHLSEARIVLVHGSLQQHGHCPTTAPMRPSNKCAAVMHGVHGVPG
jgi:hypothetical protein